MKISRKKRSTLLLILAAAALAMLHLYIQGRNIDYNYEYVKQRMKFLDLYNQNRYLSSQVAERGSLERIEKIAKERLDMVYADQIQYIIASREAE
jgi:cell division protein FtsL